MFVYLLEHLRRPPAAAANAHAMYIASLDDVVCHGPLRSGDGDVVCLHAESESAAEAIAIADPLVAYGFTLYQLREIDRIERLPELAPLAAH